MNSVKLCVDSRRTATVKNLTPATPDTVNNKDLTPFKHALDPGSLLVKIAASTLCGTDVHRWHGPLGDGDTLPIITGHEPCGYVEDIAGQRTDILGNPVKRGDRIVWSYVACRRKALFPGMHTPLSTVNTNSPTHS